MRIGHIEVLDAEGENFLFHFLDVVGLEFQVGCLQKVALIQSDALPDKAEVDVIQLKIGPLHRFLLWLCSPGHRNKISESCPVLIAQQKPPCDFQELPLP